MTEADFKAASDFIHEWINEEAKPHGSSHMRVVRDALAALIHDQRQAALKEGLTLTVDGPGFKEEPIVLISGPSERMKACYDACAGLNPEALPALMEAAKAVLDAATAYEDSGTDLPTAGAEIDVLREVLEKIGRAS